MPNNIINPGSPLEFVLSGPTKLTVPRTGTLLTAESAGDSFSVKIFGAAGDFVPATNTGTDDTAAFTAAVNAAFAAKSPTSLYCPTIFVPPGNYLVSGLAITGMDKLSFYGPGAVLFVKIDAVPVTFDNCREILWQGIKVGTTISTTNAGTWLKPGCINAKLVDWGTVYGGNASGKLTYGLRSDGNYTMEIDAPYTDEFSVSDIGMWFTAAGGSPPAAMDIRSANVGAGNTGIKIENATGFNIDGGTVEDNSSTKNVWCISCTNINIRRTHFEVPSVNSSNVYFDTCTNCVVDTIQRNAYIDLVSSARCHLRNLSPVARLRVDNASTDTVLIGGQVDSAPHGLTEELGSNTMLLGMPIADGGGFIVYRHQGTELYRIDRNGSIGAFVKFKGDSNAILFWSATGVIRGTGSLTMDGGFTSSAGTVSAATGAFTTITGNGSAITSINAANIASGDLARARFNTTINANPAAANFTNLTLGNPANAAPAGYFIKTGEDARGGTDTNTAGGSATYKAGIGTGTGTVAQHIFQVPVIAASGSTQQTSTNALVFDSTTFTVSVNAVFTGNIQFAAATVVRFPARGKVAFNADGIQQLTKDDGTTGVSLDVTTLNRLSVLKLDKSGSGETATGGLFIKSGTNLKAGTFTLVAGTVTHANTSVTANSVITVTLKTASGTRTGNPDIVPTAGVGFVATGAATDAGTYNYTITELF